MRNSVTQEHINWIVKNSDFEIIEKYGKMTIVICTLPCGFILTESSACVDPANYSKEMGESICRERITNKIWEIEGYLLQEQMHEQEDLDAYYANKYDQQKREELYQKAINRYGEAVQAMVAVEEMNELSKELIKNAMRGKDNRSEIAEEIADVKIMLEQMELLFDCFDDVERFKSKKIDRLAERIGGYE